MADTDLTMQDVLRRLEAAERQLAMRPTAGVAVPKVRRRVRGSGRFLAVLALALLIMLVPLSVFAAGPFTDLDPGQDGSTGHNPNIQAIADAGITTGCNPPDNNNYCPKDTVTREQMASFLARTAGLGANKPVARAARLAVSSPTASSPSFAANELVYVAQQRTLVNQPISADETAYGAVVTVNMPADGFVMIDAIAKFTFDTGTCNPCNVAALVRHQQSGAPSVASVVSVMDTPGYRVANPVNWVFPVQAGFNSFELRVYRSANPVSAGKVNVTSSSLSAVYVPFGAVESNSATPTEQP